MGKKLGADSICRKEAWDRLCSGEDVHFKNVFNSYYKSMYGYGVKLCNKPEVVKDCIQELFRNIWERRDELTHIESPNVYLFVSLRRKIINKLKAQRKESGDLDEIGEELTIYFGQEEIIIKDEIKFKQREKLQQALNQLSNRQKEVVYLHFYNGMSYAEIEKILSINRQSVRNYMYRAMENLRSLLDNEEAMKLVISLLVVFLFSV